ncbi:MAG: glycolate oxidase subunit GlcF [Pseudomonadales bacterium]
MQTKLPLHLLATDDGVRADAILRSCVHCGFCNATCPTYQLLGDELDGPRGRIYLIKEMLETEQADEVTRLHLDRCLTCRSCETTCPSGVRYGELLEIGRQYLEAELPRRGIDRWLRRWLLAVVPRPERFGGWVRLGRAVRWLLPRRLARQLPPAPQSDGDRGAAQSQPQLRERVLLLQGCVQRTATPGVNARLMQLLSDRGIDVVSVPGETCCGSLALHLGAAEQARATMAANVDALAPLLAGVTAVISTASGCGVTVKDYVRLLADDPERREAAGRVAGQTLDVAEYLHRLDTKWRGDGSLRRVAWHPPCTLQHGQQLTGLVEALLRRAGYELVPVRDAHLCCGSAGTYSLLQPELSGRLREAKLTALDAHRPDVIATANVGCQLHLASDDGTPVVHWLELLR